MPPRSRPDDRPRPAADRINLAIRRLMDEPDTGTRAQEYQRLLIAWDDATRSDLVQAA
ncbi:hypothetical protein ACFXGT_34655 [Streptomyces sp. NPDC059352]|uniref:hypothetical protein n=1 Tax=Streptomyces sp. NPDC059352 TaxID=3346810 RepID=UPI0036840892